jgi:hypothetical protein
LTRAWFRIHAQKLIAGLLEAQRAGLLDAAQVSMLGYEVLRQHRHALAAFACNAAAFPGSANTHDRLAPPAGWWAWCACEGRRAATAL